jgi:hypothetical protein
VTTDPLIPGRVERCCNALAGYSDADRFVCLIDLLADAMHSSDANGEDFHYALAVACKHFINKLNDQQTPERRMP